MKNDPEYRDGMEHLIKLLSTRPGRMGEVLRIVSDGHAILVKVM